MAGLIRVRSVAERGRRRAGHAFSPEWTEFGLDEVTAVQLVSLLGDTELQIEGRVADAWRALSPDERAVSVEQLSEAMEEFQSAQGAEGRSEDGAPASVAPEAKDDEVKDASSADPEGTAPAAAAEAEESREGADDAMAGQGSASDEEIQPEQSLQAPVAAEDSSSEENAQEAKPKGSHRRKA